MNKKSRIHFDFFLLKTSTIVLFLSMCFVHRSIGQKPVIDSIFYKKINTNTVTAKVFTTDKLQQYYLVNEVEALEKYDIKGNLLFSYANTTLGAPAYIDASNPFQILLYYPDYATIVFLDRTLNPISEINLLTIGISQSTAVAYASDGNIWVFDDMNAQLKKINRQGNIIWESDILTPYFETPTTPTGLIESNSAIYLKLPEEGIVVFDIYGQYDKTILISNLQNFQIIDNQLIYNTTNQLKSYHLQSFTERDIPFPATVNLQFLRIEKQRLFIADSKKVVVYSF